MARRKMIDRLGSLLFRFVNDLLYSLVYFVSDRMILHARARARFLARTHKNFVFGSRVSIRKNITFYGGGERKGSLVIGQRSAINDECLIDYSSEIVIGENVAIGMRSILLTSSHHIGTPKRCGSGKRMRTRIGDNTWLGAGVLVYPGVTIGSGCVISAGEIVSGDIPDNHIYKNSRMILIDEDKCHRESE